MGTQTRTERVMANNKFVYLWSPHTLHQSLRPLSLRRRSMDIFQMADRTIDHQQLVLDQMFICADYMEYQEMGFSHRMIYRVEYNFWTRAIRIFKLAACLVLCVCWKQITCCWLISLWVNIEMKYYVAKSKSSCSAEGHIGHNFWAMARTSHSCYGLLMLNKLIYAFD